MLLFIGSRGRGPVPSTLLGSVSAEVDEDGALPRLVTPRGSGPENSTRAATRRRTGAPRNAPSSDDRRGAISIRERTSHIPAGAHPRERRPGHSRHGRRDAVGGGLCRGAPRSRGLSELRLRSERGSGDARSAGSTTPSAIASRSASRTSLIVQDPTLLHQVDVFGGLAADGSVLINSGKDPDALGLGDPCVHSQRPES